MGWTALYDRPLDETDWEAVTLSQCGHHFCLECIAHWLAGDQEASLSCPMCHADTGEVPDLSPLESYQSPRQPISNHFLPMTSNSSLAGVRSVLNMLSCIFNMLNLHLNLLVLT